MQEREASLGRWDPPPSWYMHSCTLGRWEPSLPVHQPAVLHIMYVNVMTPACSSVSSVEHPRAGREEEGYSHPENKPLWARKGLPFGKETRHRKHLCTRMSLIVYPLQK